MCSLHSAGPQMSVSLYLALSAPTMKYAIYEDPVTRRFAHLPLPSRFLEGDALPAIATDRWFETHAAAIAALAELLDRDDDDPKSEPEVKAETFAAPTLTTPTMQVDLTKRPGVWLLH